MTVSTKHLALNRSKIPLFAGIMAAASIFPGGPMHALPAAVLLPLWVIAAVALAGWVRLPKAARWLEGGALVVLFAGYFSLKSVGIRASRTDENIYFYMIDRMLHGAVPYRDFFFAHPIGHLLFPAPFFVFGFHLWLAKLVPVLAVGVGAGMVYASWRRTHDFIAAAASSFLFLFAYQVLMASTNMNGENLATMFLAVSLWALIRRRPTFAGVAAGAALSCGLYNIAGVLTLGLASWWLVQRAAVKRFALGWFISFGALFALGWLLAGGGYLDQVITYHLHKAPRAGHLSLFSASGPVAFLSAYAHDIALFATGKRFKTLLYYHAPQFLLLAGSVALLLVRLASGLFRVNAPVTVRLRTSLASLDQRARLALTGVLGVALFSVEFAALNEVYSFYFVPLLLMLALPGGYLVSELLRTRTSDSPLGFWPPVALLALLWLHLPLDRAVARTLWPSESRHAGQLVHYTWRDPIAFVPASHVARSLFFTNSRERAAVTPYHRHYIWNKSLGFSKASAVAALVRAKIRPGQTISGASDLAPLIALLAHVRIASDEADTNGKRFRSGNLSHHEFLKDALADHLRFIIAAPGGHFSRPLMMRNPVFYRRFRRVDTVVDRTVLHHDRPFAIDLFELRTVPPAP